MTDGADLDDAVALHEDFPWLDDLPGFDVEQARGVQHDRVGRSWSDWPAAFSTSQTEREHEQKAVRIVISPAMVSLRFRGASAGAKAGIHVARSRVPLL